MSDLKLFRVVHGKAEELSGSSVALERHLQRTIESNMETLLGFVSWRPSIRRVPSIVVESTRLASMTPALR